MANDACDGERVSVNGKVVKPSYNVKIGDIIQIAFGTKCVSVRVLDIRETTKKAESIGMYEVLSESDV